MQFSELDIMIIKHALDQSIRAETAVLLWTLEFVQFQQQQSSSLSSKDSSSDGSQHGCTAHAMRKVMLKAGFGKRIGDHGTTQSHSHTVTPRSARPGKEKARHK